MIKRRDRREERASLIKEREVTAVDGFAFATKNNAISDYGLKAPAPMPGRNASAALTKSSLKGFQNHSLAAAQINAITASGLTDELTDQQVHELHEAIEVTPENLPAIISTAITNSEDNLIIPEWHMVRNLPGYYQNAIRALGRQIFTQFTDTPIEDIQTVTTLSNETHEVQALMAWIKKNGIKDDEANLDFTNSIPGYQADTQLWNVEDTTFLLVRDPHGYYVYGWPGGRGVHLDNDDPLPMLR